MEKIAENQENNYNNCTQIKKNIYFLLNKNIRIR